MVLWWIRFWFWDLRILFSGEPARVHASLVAGLCVTMVTVNEHNNGKNGSSAGFGPVAPDISLIWSSADGFLCRPMMSQFTQLFKVRTCYFGLNALAGSKFGSEPCQCGTTMSGLWAVSSTRREPPEMLALWGEDEWRLAWPPWSDTWSVSWSGFLSGDGGPADIWTHLGGDPGFNRQIQGASEEEEQFLSLSAEVTWSQQETELLLD